MQISSCLNPQIIKNPYTHEYCRVPCGKCDACLLTRPFAWKLRLDDEQIRHRYTVFFTLTYDDDFLPLYKTGSAVHPVDIDKFGQPRSVESISDFCDSVTFGSYGSLAVLSHSDVSRFIKHLKNILLNYDKENSFPKWFIVGEYGGRRQRPHYHGLLFFDSPSFAKHVKESIVSAWSKKLAYPDNYNIRRPIDAPIGRVDVQFVSKSATSYVSSYLNIVAVLPTCLQGDFRQFHSQSRGTIGYDLFTSDELREIFYTGACCYEQESVKNHERISTVVPVGVAARLFPTVSRVRFRFGRYDSQGVLNLFSSKWRRKKFASFGVENNNEDTINNRLNVINGFVRRCNNLSLIYHVPLRFVLSRIDQYLSNVELLKLRNFYDYQQQLVSPFIDGKINDPLPTEDLINLYFLGDSSTGDLVPEQCFQSFGLDYSSVFMHYNPSTLLQQQSFEHKVHKIVLDSLKTKHRNFNTRDL